MKAVALRIGAGLSLMLALTWAVGAEKAPDPNAPPTGDLASDIQDIVYFTDTRPLVVRLHIEVDGKGFQERWDNFVFKLFQQLDRDNDAALSETEAGRGPSPQQFQSMARGQFFNQNPGAPTANVNDMDANGDQKITAEEFATYYRRNGVGPIAAQPGPTRGPQDPLTNNLFDRLDKDKNGKMAKDELLAAAKVFAGLDADDDELVSLQELLGTVNPQVIPPPVQPPVGGVMAGLPPDSPFFVVIPDGSPKRFSQRLLLSKEVLRRYDKSKNDKLSKDEVAYDEATFKRLDINGDGEIDSTELLRLLNPPADLELTLRLGRLDAGKTVADILTPDGKPAPMAAVVRKTSTGSLMLTLDEVQIDLRRGESFNQGFNLRQTYQQQFRQLDREKQGFVDQKQVQQPQGQFLRGVFALADKDGDGKMTEKELEAVADLQAAGINCTTTVTIGDNGNGLFEMFDINRDGKLSVPELRTMWSRLSPFDRDKDGSIMRSELPRQLQVTVSPGPLQNQGRGGVVVNPFGGPAGAAPESNVGPLWFRKMDRNSDGWVSPREFFGSKEDFDRIDTDSDGFLSPDEAEKAEALFRK